MASLKPRVMVIAAMGIGATRKFYPDLPIVFTAVAADPIALGLAHSYAHPGGMITGNIMNAVGGEETMAQKRLGFFRELVPDLKRLGIVGPSTGPLLTKEREALQKIADKAGFEITFYDVKSSSDLQGSFAGALNDEVSAIYISGEPLLFSKMAMVMTGIRKARIRSLPRMGTCRSPHVILDRPYRGMAQRGLVCGKDIKGSQAR
ncbi:ABC transporter substrate binding protein [Bradyrhizobium sp. MOS002]|uniref:ABC transporter substrate binding protein n=1 Tax=Bradyrhizobium sp. MOS002 TaxID=2133947 RepID=UPI000D132F67|nr:ABC transporter substrate binding protein [Bradyrhizobium sp. MOS002]PSO25947.1 hypothetical protein C7G41_28590 [Bradyrhizobium sp. MOS002]